MLTKEQWQDAARFAGKPINGEYQNGRWPFTRHHYLAQPRPWRPDTDWSDFGPLWVKLERWADRNQEVWTRNKFIYEQIRLFDNCIYKGPDAELMQAGLLLAAAIGKTMKEERK